MTASKPPYDESHARPAIPGPLPGPLPGAHLATTAQLMDRITTELGSRLSLVSLDGTRRKAPPPTPPALVLVARGSRDPRDRGTVRTLAERVRELRPRLSVHLGHLERNEPSLPGTLAGLGTRRAVLVPLLLTRGRHVTHDIPEAVAAAPADTVTAPPLGPHPLLVEALYARLVEAGWPTTLSETRRRASAVVLAAAGPRDPDSGADTRGTARLLAERLGVPVVPAYASAATPTVPEAVRALTARGRHRIAVASCFAAPGRLAAACAAAAPWIAAEPLGAHPALARLVVHRYDQARATWERSAAATPVSA
ncbi:sirohydrochlorin chelatase [Streptomyces sp. NPDC048664]|uniref:sirohydrochlorin chelatase n=1 Tax=Streptomyces sp. NPDC048664 TaxID=3154505 RepID=UPI00343E89B8